ncbi:AfsR/SARP family transcriptional regulator [Flindersiella endophytica]
MELRVLGRIELSSNARTVTIAAARQRGLLALLVLERGRSPSSDWLIDQLWDGAPPPAAKATLQSCVYRLRRIFAELDLPIELLTRSNGYLLSLPPCALDLDRFEQAVAEGRQAMEAGRLAEAVAAFRSGLELWRGEAFEGIDVALVREHADRLRERRLDVTEQCLEAELAGGRHADVADELAELTGTYPLRESLWRLRMLALARGGRRTEALDAYGELGRLLDDQLGLEPSTPVHQLYEQILADDPVLALPSAVVAPAVTARTIPRMLPAAIGDFTGRRTQLARLDALVPLDGSDQPEPVVISAISGTAGIGKTMLAVHWAHRIAHRFPDGQLYVNLRGFHPTGQPVPPAEALRGFLDALGVPAEAIPAGLDARIGMYRSLLADRKVIVLLDNARDSEQARPLLPGAPGCLVVVTSRNRLGGLVGAEAARPVLLDLLTTEESRELLARRLGTDRTDAEPQAVEAIIDSCARLPLALVIAAARAATNPDFPLRVLADELAETSGGLDAFAGSDPAADVRAVFSWSYRQLSKPAARLFRLLGLHPGPDISGPAAASLAGMPLGQARSLLAELTRSHLLTQHQPGRYTFHDLLRAYATELVREDASAERDDATRRMLDHYVHTGHSAAFLIAPYRDRVPLGAAAPGVSAEALDSHDAAMGWYIAERPALLALIDQTTAEGFDADTWWLAWMLATFLERHGRWNEWAASQRAAKAAARRAGDPAKEALASRLLAGAIYKLGDNYSSYAELLNALDLYAQLGDHIGQARVHRNLGWVLSRLDRHDEALEHTEQALELSRTAGDRTGQAIALNAIGWRHAQLGEYEQTVTYCEQALALHKESGNPNGEASASDSLGYAYHHLGQYRRALTSYRRALELLRQQGNRSYVAEVLEHLGDAYEAMGDRGAARQHWRRALEILQELGVRGAEALRTKLGAPAADSESGSGAGPERQHVG